jgi:hypothetical protein
MRQNTLFGIYAIFGTLCLVFSFSRMFHARLALDGHFTHRNAAITGQIQRIAAGKDCYAEHISGHGATLDASVTESDSPGVPFRPSCPRPSG